MILIPLDKKKTEIFVPSGKACLMSLLLLVLSFNSLFTQCLKKDLASDKLLTLWWLLGNLLT